MVNASNAVVLSVSADELYEGHLPPEIERDHQAVVSSCNFESEALTVQHLGFRSRSMNLIRRGPTRSVG
jgi:hypothetical protein